MYESKFCDEIADEKYLLIDSNKKMQSFESLYQTCKYSGRIIAKVALIMNVRGKTEKVLQNIKNIHYHNSTMKNKNIDCNYLQCLQFISMAGK